MRHNKLWKKAMALTCAAECAATTLAGCGSSTQAEKPSEKTEAQGESGAAEGQTEIIHLPYGIMRQPTTGKNW